MPIIDVEIVGDAEPATGSPSAATLADTLGGIFGTAPGRTWVRLRGLPPSAYAENGIEITAAGLPVFVTVLHARPPEGDARAAEVLAVTRAVADWARRDPQRVHVQYAPAAAGRQAFGGTLVE
jgi:phenylpyruvate tautomerase PptA (4-oxalocrotonate tautomerase family)